MKNAFVAAPMSRNAIRQIVEILRDSFGLKNKKYFPVVEFFEQGLSEIDENYTFEIKELWEMSEYGVAYPRENKIVLREDVYLRAIDGVPRDRFTIAHEIGHYLIHRPERIGLARSEEKPKPFMDPEWQANTFAGELLVPSYLIEGLSVEQIITEFGVSRAVAEIQIKQRSR